MNRLQVLSLAGLLLAACVSPSERRARSFKAAAAAMEIGQTERAVSLLENTLSFDPRDYEARRRLAVVELGRQQESRAFQALQGLPGDVEPDDAYRELEARVLVEVGRWERALPLVLAIERQRGAGQDLIDDLLLGVSRWNPNVDLPQAWLRRVFDFQLDDKKIPAALRTARRLAEPQRSEALDLLFQAVLECACSLNERLPELREEPGSPWKLLLLHRRLMARGAGGKAAVVEQDFLAKFPGHSERFRILLSKARRDVRMGKSEEGLDAALQAAALEPEHVEPQIEKGLALAALGRKREAVEAFDLALAIDPNHTVARRFLDRLEKAKGQNPVTLRIETTESLRYGSR